MCKKELYKRLLRDTGLKATPTRIAVLQTFDHLKKPLSVDDIKERIRFADVATLYRTVESFVDKGIIRSMHVCGPRRCFELSALPHHHHIICKKCGTIEDIHDCNLAKVIQKIESTSEKFDHIMEHTFELFGLCKRCQQNKKK